MCVCAVLAVPAKPAQPRDAAPERDRVPGDMRSGLLPWSCGHPEGQPTRIRLAEAWLGGRLDGHPTPRVRLFVCDGLRVFLYLMCSMNGLSGFNGSQE